MKKILFYLMLFLITINISATELIHAYFGDYREVIRLVFVFNAEVHHSTIMNTDDRVINITAYNTRVSPSMLPLSFEKTPLIDMVEYTRLGNNLNIAIYTGIVFFAEIFDLRYPNFRLVVDIYRQREPLHIEAARDYLFFFRSVGFTDRANEMQARIDRGEFPPAPTIAIREARPSVIIPDHALINPFIDIQVFEKPDISDLDPTSQTWITQAFYTYDIFVEFYELLVRAEQTLRYYETKRVIDLHFIEIISANLNFLNEANIRLNEIRLRFRNTVANRIDTSQHPIVLTNSMINHITGVLDDLEMRIRYLQMQYNLRIST